MIARSLRLPSFRLIHGILLAGLIALGTGLRLWGLEWGVPTHERFTTLYVDEYTPIHVLSGMAPRKLEFNPHYFFDPTFFYYQLGITYQLAAWAHRLTLSSSQAYYLEHPEAYAQLYLWGRYAVTAYAVLMIVLMTLLGGLISQSAAGGLLSGLFYAVIPASVVSSHVLDLAVPISFWLGLSFFGLVRAFETGERRWLLASAFCIGLTLSTKYTALPIPMAMAYVLWSRWRTISAWAAAAGLVVLGFVLGSPYVILDFPEFKTGLQKAFTMAVVAKPAFSLSYYLSPFTHYPFAVGTVLSILCVIGLIHQWHQRKPAAQLAAFFLIPYFVLLARSNFHVTRYVNETLPFLLPFGAAALIRLLHSSLPKVRTLGGLILVLALARVPYTLAIDHSLASETDPRDQASEWIKANIRPNSLIGLEKEANFFTPGHLYMQYWKGTRYPSSAVAPPPYRFAVCDPLTGRWPGDRPDYWIGSNLHFSRFGRKNPNDIKKVEQVQRDLARGYQPVKTFAREVEWGPFHFSTPEHSGLEWLIFFPEITIYKRIS